MLPLRENLVSTTMKRIKLHVQSAKEIQIILIGSKVMDFTVWQQKNKTLLNFTFFRDF